jgi:hypothetical protein
MADLTLSANADTLLACANFAAMRTALSLGNVENTALSTWTGSTGITTLGTIGTGTWQGTIIAPAYLGTGSSITTKYLRGDGTWQTISGGGDALTSGNLSQFAATTSAQLAGVISDETGTGALVFANSPTLVTPALGTPSSATLTNATGLPLAGLAQSSATSGQVPTWNGSAWAAATPSTGSGDLLAANNLSDVASATTSRANLKAHPRGDYFYDIADYATANQRNGTDDATSAVQTALTAIETAMLANNGGRYVLWLGDAILKIDGALQTTNSNNTQLVLPALDLIDDAQCSLVIRGAAPVTSQYSVIGTIPVPTGGAVIKSTLTTGGGTRPSVMAGRAPTGASWLFSMLFLTLENVEIRTVPNPLISGLDCSYVGGLEMINSSVTTGTYTVATVTTPTTSTSVGVIAPGNSNNVYSHFHQAYVIGFYTGFRLNEHSTGDAVASGCLTGFELTDTYHGSIMTRLGSVHCAVPIRAVGGSSRWIVGLLMIERATSGAFTAANDIEDASNYLAGRCNYASVVAGVGETDLFAKNGGVNFECSAVGDNIIPVWSALSGTTPELAFVNTPKVGTLTMSGDTTFTASGYAQGRKYTLFLTGATSTRTLTFPDWTWSGTAPANLAATATLKIELVCTGSTEQSVFASHLVATTASGFDTITDTFTRADNASAIGTSTSGDNPTVLVGTWGIAGNKAYIATGSDASSNYNLATWDNGSADVTIEADILTPSSGDFAIGLAMRVADASNFLFAQLTLVGSDSDIYLYKRIAGTYTALATLSGQTYANNTTYNLKVVLSGTSIEVFVDDVSKLTYNTTTTLEAETAHGFTFYSGATDTGARWDNLSITTP